jgi:Periplasmic binding protein
MGDFGALLCLVAALALVGAGPEGEILVGLGAPMTGPYSWPGGTTKETFELAIADLNARGGVLGQTVQVIEADDYCDGEQAVAAANKLLAARVVAGLRPPVLGRRDSGLEDLCRRRNPDDRDRSHQPLADRARVHERVPHGRPG